MQQRFPRKIWHRKSVTHLFLGTREMFCHNVDAFPVLFSPRFLIDDVHGGCWCDLVGMCLCWGTWGWPGLSWLGVASLGWSCNTYLAIFLCQKSQKDLNYLVISICACRDIPDWWCLYKMGISLGNASSLPTILQGAVCNLIKALLSILLPPQTGFL